ncbi:SAM-dependent methyltransferase [Spirosoma daeguense]
MKLAEVVPWGRTLDEYQRMFNLTDTDLSKRIVGVGDGPASFNAEMSAVGHSVVSIDPIYIFSETELKQRIDDTYQTVKRQLHEHSEQYNWTTFRDVESVCHERMRAMNLFLSDYEQGLQQSRYLPISLPKLPFSDGSFDVVLCSHLLFLYSEQLSETFHLESIRELIRVANDVRIFPIISLDGQPSSYLSTVVMECQAKGIQADIVNVDYHFQKGAHQMLRLSTNFTEPNR